MTKREMFTAILAIDAVAQNAEMVDFLKHEISLLDARKGASRKPTKAQKENLEIKKVIYQVISEADKPMRIRDMMEDSRLCDYAKEKITALVTQMRKDKHEDGVLIRTMDKKVAYFSIAEEADDFALENNSEDD